MKTSKKEQIMSCSDFNQLLNVEYGKRGTQAREQFEAEAEAFALGELLRQERETIGLTQQQLAEQSGYNKKTISRLESGHSDVSLSSIFHIFAGMGRKVAVSVLTILLLLTFGIGQMWAEEDIGAGMHGRAKPPMKPTDTAVVITPTISIQDTIYLKHEEMNTTSKSWWDVYGGGLLSIFTLLLGACITWATTAWHDKRSRKYRRQDLIIDEAIKTEREIYERLVKIKNAKTAKAVKAVLPDMKTELQKAKLSMRPELHAVARDIYGYFFNWSNSPDGERQTEIEEQLFDKYYTIFTHV